MNATFIDYLQGCCSNYYTLNEAQIRAFANIDVNSVDLIIIAEGPKTYCFLIKIVDHLPLSLFLQNATNLMQVFNSKNPGMVYLPVYISNKYDMNVEQELSKYNIKYLIPTTHFSDSRLSADDPQKQMLMQLYSYIVSHTQIYKPLIDYPDHTEDTLMSIIN